jgi:tetratricopeptide (TPR) repeat protein
MTEELLSGKKLDELLTQEEMLKQSFKSLQQGDRKKLVSLLMVHVLNLHEKTPTEELAYARRAAEIAAEFVPESAELELAKAAMLFVPNPDPQEEELLGALAHCDRALELEEDLFLGHYLRARILLRLGVLSNDSTRLEEADREFEKASQRLSGQERKIQGEFYWQWGISDLAAARVSGEASDLSRAISHFRHAQEFAPESGDFCVDFAQTLINFGNLVNREELYFEAIELLEKGRQKFSKENKEGLADLMRARAQAYMALFFTHLSRDYFSLAHEAFDTGSKLSIASHDALLNWGSLLLVAYSIWNEEELLGACVDKLEQAYNMKKECPELLARYAKALSLEALEEESIELFRKALAVIDLGNALAPDSTEIIASRTAVLCRLGTYLGDEKYYGEALEHTRRALLRHEGNGYLLHQKATCGFLLSQHNSELSILEESLKDFEAASDTSVARFGYFWNDWGMAFLSLADLTHSMKYFHDALGCFERAITLHDTIVPEWLFNYGCTLDFLGDLTDDESYYERAIQSFQGVLALDPEFLPAKTHLAFSLTHIGELLGDVDSIRAALAFFEKAAHEDPEDDMVFTEWGLALIHLVELTQDAVLPQDPTLLQKAEECFRKAQNLGDLGASYNLACLHAFQGHIPESLFYFQKAFDAASLPPVEVLVQDDWLTNIRETLCYKEIVSLLRKAEDE